MSAAVALVSSMFIAGATCVVGGIYMLAGAAWCLITLGALLLVVAFSIRAGLKSNG